MRVVCRLPQPHLLSLWSKISCHSCGRWLQKSNHEQQSTTSSELIVMQYFSSNFVINASHFATEICKIMLLQNFFHQLLSLLVAFQKLLSKYNSCSTHARVLLCSANTHEEEPLITLGSGDDRFAAGN